MTSPEGIPQNKPTQENASPAIEGLKFEYGEFSQTGSVHLENGKGNEDTFFSLPGRGVFGVFDGVGGLGAGGIASTLAKDYIKSALDRLPPSLREEELLEQLKKIFIEANDFILAEAEKDFKLKHMATTASVVKFWNSGAGKQKAIIANAGDSRVYILRKNGELEQITVDDSQANLFLTATKGKEEAKKLQEKFNNLVDESGLSALERGFWGMRNKISQALGTPGCSPNMYSVDINDGDIILISSDGIHDNLTDTKTNGSTPSMADILRQEKSSQEMAKSLVKISEEKSEKGEFRSKKDDMTALVIKVLAA